MSFSLVIVTYTCAKTYNSNLNSPFCVAYMNGQGWPFCIRKLIRGSFCRTLTFQLLTSLSRLQFFVSWWEFALSCYHVYWCIFVQVLLRQPYCCGIMVKASLSFLEDAISAGLLSFQLSPPTHSSVTFLEHRSWVVEVSAEVGAPHDPLLSVFWTCVVSCSGPCSREKFLGWVMRAPLTRRHKAKYLECS